MVRQDLDVAFCHNDLLAANILYNDHSGKVQLIDFEYGGINFVTFDIANHWNEYAGGPPDSPQTNYALLPNATQRQAFCRAYLLEQQRLSTATDNQKQVQVTDQQVSEFLSQVETFLMPNHLYWGFWAVNQAATEGCQEFDYMEFARNRLAQYWVCKQQVVK